MPDKLALHGRPDITAKTGLQGKGAQPVPAKQLSFSGTELKSPVQALPEPLLEALESPGEKAVYIREFFKQTAAALGFPKDQLSVVLLEFARLFSLSPSLLGALRREFLSSSKNSSHGNTTPTAKEKASLEAGALAAAAALDKGVSLSPEAHTHYSSFFVPPASGDKEGGGERKDREEAPESEELQAIAEEEAAEDGLLDFLNSLPGKNGQHWTVFPFTVKVRGIELRVFIRILKREQLSSPEGSCLIADIRGPKRQWRCFLSESAGKIKADLRVKPELSARTLKLLKKEAKRFLAFDEVTVVNMDDSVSWVEDFFIESLLSINKEV